MLSQTASVWGQVDTQGIKEYFEGYVDICNTVEEWEEAIQRNLDGNSISTPEERMNYARKNDWENRVDKFEGFIYDMIGNKKPH